MQTSSRCRSDSYAILMRFRNLGAIHMRFLCDSYAIPMRFLCDSYAIPRGDSKTILSHFPRGRVGMPSRTLRLNGSWRSLHTYPRKFGRGKCEDAGIMDFQTQTTLWPKLCMRCSANFRWFLRRAVVGIVVIILTVKTQSGNTQAALSHLHSIHSALRLPKSMTAIWLFVD